MAQKTEIQSARDQAKSMGLSAAGGLKAIQARIAEATPVAKKGSTAKADKPVLTAEELHAKRSAAAQKAVQTMRDNGTLPPAKEKVPVDPALSARANAAWATRRANAAAAAAEKAS